MKHTATAWYAGTALLMTMSLVVLIPEWDVAAWRELIRMTARTSLFFFLLAYTASAVWQQWPTAATHWIRARRKQWGLLLMTSHGIHLLGILAFWHMDPLAFAKQVSTANLISGGLAYLFLIAMGLTSHPRLARQLSPVWWGRLHTWGMHYLLLSFLVANGKRIPIDNSYLIPVLVSLAALGLRQFSRRTSRALIG
ncbi:MAG: hypothetical protein ACK4F8_03380 [Aquabacterium sp.]